MRLPSPPPSRPVRSLAALLLLADVAAGSPARAADPASASPEPSPRATAVETEIRHLERHLQALRKARTELNAGRPEPAPSDEDARRAPASLTLGMYPLQ